MGVTKTKLFSAEQNRIAELGKAFSHPARIAIIQYLLQTNACVCGDLVEVLPLSQSTVSQHLKELKRVGILKGNVEGTSVCYCINETTWAEVQQTFNQIFKSFKGGCC